MKFTHNDSLKIDIDNYSGPLEILLDLAKSQNNTHIIGVKYSQILMICKKNGDLGT